MVHVVSRLVAVVEEREFAAVSRLRRGNVMLHAPLDERRHVLHVVHTLLVRAAPDHREMPARNLVQFFCLRAFRPSLTLIPPEAVLRGYNPGAAFCCFK